MTSLANLNSLANSTGSTSEDITTASLATLVEYASHTEVYKIEEALTNKTFCIGLESLEVHTIVDTEERSANEVDSDSLNSVDSSVNPVTYIKDDYLYKAICAQIQANLANKSLVNRLAKLLCLLNGIAANEKITLHQAASNSKNLLTRYGFGYAGEAEALVTTDEDGNPVYQHEWSHLNEAEPAADGSIPLPEGLTDKYGFFHTHDTCFVSGDTPFLKPLNSKAKSIYKVVELEAAQLIWRLRIETLYNDAMDGFKASNTYTEEEQATFAMQYEEAKAFKADANASTPLLDEIARIRGLNKEDLATKVLSKAAKRNFIYAGLNATKAKLLDQVDQVKSEKDVRSISLKPLKSIVS